jgi:hypothetical protein
MRRGSMPTAASRVGLALTIGLALGMPLAAMAAPPPAYPGFQWMSGSGDGNASLVFGSPETAEDWLFALDCRGKEKATKATLYVDIEGSEIGQKTAIEFSVGDAKLALDGTIATDEMSGFHFAEARGFKIKPVIALLKAKGAVAVKSGNVVVSLPEKGRAAELSAFAKVCKLD